MMFQPQFYGLKSFVAIYTSVNDVYKVVKHRELLTGQSSL